MDFEHAAMSSSRLRPPTKVQIPTAGGLAEMTASDTNVRSAMAPPAIPSHALKHKASGSECNTGKQENETKENKQLTRSQPPVFESQNNKMQRQTLAERAGQPHSSRPAPPTIRQVNGDVRRIAQNGPSSSTSFSSTHGPTSRGLPVPGFANSTTTRPGMSARAQSQMGHSRSRSQYGQRPASVAGHNRTLSASTMGQSIPAASVAPPVQTVNSNGTVPPFLSLTTQQQPDVITSYNVQQRPARRNLQQRQQQWRGASASRSTSASSNATTLLDDMSERSVSLPDPFVSASSTGNRISSLTTRFEKLEVKSQETAQEINGEDAQMDFKMEGGDNDDRFLMPPPPVPTKSLKHASSLPVMSEQFKNSTMHSPVGQRMEDMSMRRSANPQHDLSFVTPRSKKVNGNASPTKKTPKTTQKMFYPSKDSLTPIPAWTEEAIERRLRGFDDVMQLMNKQMEGTTFNHQFLKDTIESQRDQLAELTMQQKNFGLQNESLKEELGELKEENSGLVMIQTELQRNHEIEVDDMERKQRHEVENLREEHRKEVDRLRREASADRDETIRSHRHEVDELVRKHRVELEDMEKRYRSELDEEKARRIKEVEEISQKRDEAISRIASGIGEKEREADAVRDELVHKQADLERERLLRASLESKFSETSANLIALESSNASMKAKINYLESDNQQQSNQFADLHKRMQEAIEQAAIASTKLRAEESVRRKLHNQIQELKGNIRVFCRVRPTLGNDEGPAEIAFPDTAEESKEIIVKGDEKTSALGKVTAANYAFNFDRVFGPRSQNSDVFDEISQLVQSSLDGYNVCIFCYGQTGSGKTHTMSSADGMIPRAVRQIYETAKELEEKGWTYKMTGQFVEVYNENINDLLGNSDDLDKKKHDIKHDMKTCKTTITDVEIMALDSPDMVTTVLEKADKNRSVAATKANMRSSRSHSVFILTLVGENTISGEKCEGTLNLVDLAGSERLAHSQVEGARLKETQSINKSLSCLGDVIGALGQKGEGGHIPYRNSKLTYLLQFSLGGNSKTLMFVMVSPLQAHLAETLTSLKFATKVHNTHIGTAKRQSKVTAH